MTTYVNGKVLPKIVVTKQPAIIPYLLKLGTITEGEYEVVEEATPE